MVCEHKLWIPLAIYIARNLLNRQKNFTGKSFWAQGYFVSTVGLNEEKIRKYIKNQDKDDRDQDELGLF